jgi:DNA polymerase III delta prime subunit
MLEPWVEKYRPNSVKDCILPESIKSTLLSYIEKGDFPNLLLCGSAGVGKTSVAKALCKDLDFEYIFINGSDERNIAVVRDRIMSYGTTSSFDGKRKCIIIDESDNLSPNTTQPALRGVIEDLSHIRFIFTCNYPNKIIEPLHSRLSTIQFQFKDIEDKKKTFAEFEKRVKDILDQEDVKYEPVSLRKFIFTNYPDNRKILNTLQGNRHDLTDIDVLDDNKLDEVLKLIIRKDFKGLQKWTFESQTSASFFISLYKLLNNKVSNDMIPLLAIVFADSQDKYGRSVEPKITILGLLALLIKDFDFKNE